MKIRRTFILTLTAILLIPVSIFLVEPARSEGMIGEESAAGPIFLPGGDFSGDGLEDICVFQPESATWRVRGLTITSFGREGDYPTAGDYDGDGYAEIAVFRPESGLWAMRGLTRFYFGLPGDLPAARDYTGDGVWDPAVFRPRTGLWAIRGVGLAWFGREGDLPVPANYTGDGSVGMGIFRPATGLWAIRGLTRLYFGRPGDLPVPGDYIGEGAAGAGIYRESSGLWAIRYFTRVYFGGPGYMPAPLYYTGSPGLRIAVYDPVRGLWAVRGVTRIYSGREGGVSVPGYYPGQEPVEDPGEPAAKSGETPTATPAPTASPAPSSTPTQTPITSPTVPLIDEGFDYFHQGRRPEGWTFIDCDDDSDTYTSAGNYGRQLPSLRLSVTGAGIVTREFSQPEELTFWIKGQGTDTTSALYVDEYFSADWHRITDIYHLPTSGTDFPALALNPSTSQVKFTYFKSVGNLAFDDVRITEPATPTPIPTATPVPTPSCSPTPTRTPPPTPTPSPTVSPIPSATPSPTVSPVPTASPSPSPIPWDGGMLTNAGFELWDGSGNEADDWTWDMPEAQWTRSTDAYYAGSAGRLSREAATAGSLDQFGKTMSQGTRYFAALMVKGSGEIRIGIRYPHTPFSNYGDWTAFSGDGWTLLEHEAVPTGTGEEGGLRIQVRNCFEPCLLIDNAYLDDSRLYPTPTPIPTASAPPTATPTASVPATPPPTPSPLATATPTPFPPADPLDVVINEIGWMGTAASSADEYIELHNTTGEAINLSGWTLKAVDGTPDIALSGTIPALGYFLLERTDETTVGDIAADQIYTGSLGNTGELLELRDGTGGLIDAAGDDTGIWFAGELSPGFNTMERNNPSSTGTGSANWRSNDGCLVNGLDADDNPLNASPKSLNSAHYPSRPGQLDLNAGDETVTLSWTASDPGRYDLAGYNVYRRLSGGEYGEPLNPVPIGGLYYLDETVTNGMRYFYTVKAVDAAENESVCGSNEATVIPGPPPVLGENVIISEVMFNPVGDGLLHEWFELFNPTNQAIGLDGWWVANEDQRGKYTFPAGGDLEIPAGQFLVLGASQYANDGDVDVVYNNQSTTEGNIRLRDSGDEVSLYNELDELVDRVTYSGNWIRTAGHSIVRKAVTRSSNFVELENIGDRPVNLAGLRIFDGLETDTIQAWSTSETMLEPSGYALIVNNLFYNRYAIPAGTVTVTCGDLALGSGLTPYKDLALYDLDGETVVDTFTSFSAVQDPPVNSSVEKINPQTGDFEANWGLSTDPTGSTPGRENSITP